MTNVQENPGAQRTRRNIMKMGAIAATAVAARVSMTNAHAKNGWGGGVGGGRGHGGNCLLKGTLVQTVDGERRIEELAVGDLLPTMFGGDRPIRWIGRYPVMNDPRNPPVRIARSALGPDIPRVDLCVTGLHAVLIDGVLIPVGSLINGVTIKLDEREFDDLAFYHIKFESHDVFFAEGAPVESFPEVDKAYCAPRASSGRHEFQSRLRSAISPLIDIRQPVEVIRDRFEERGFVDSRQFETVR
jgi:hypothetical protein